MTSHCSRNDCIGQNVCQHINPGFCENLFCPPGAKCNPRIASWCSLLLFASQSTNQALGRKTLGSLTDFLSHVCCILRTYSADKKPHYQRSFLKSVKYLFFSDKWTWRTLWNIILLNSGICSIKSKEFLGNQRECPKEEHVHSKQQMCPDCHIVCFGETIFLLPKRLL